MGGWWWRWYAINHSLLVNNTKQNVKHAAKEQRELPPTQQKDVKKRGTRSKEKGNLEEFTGQPTYTCLGALQIKGLAYFQSMKFIRLCLLWFFG